MMKRRLLRLQKSFLCLLFLTHLIKNYKLNQNYLTAMRVMRIILIVRR